MDRPPRHYENEVIHAARECHIRIKFESEDAVTMTAGGVYFNSGITDSPLPHEILPEKTIEWSSRKYLGPFLTGTGGVFTYKTSDRKTFALMWSVPFILFGSLSDIFKSRWNVRVFDGARRADQALFNEMERGANYGDNNWHGPEDIGQGYQMSGSMAASTKPILDIRVTKTASAAQNRQNN